MILLDGDDLRSIFADRWGYERSERVELARVYFRLCSHLASQGFVVVIAAIAMYDDVRAWVHTNVTNSTEVFLDVPRQVRLTRDAGTKKVYSSGVDLEAIYDPSVSPDLRIENFGEKSAVDTANQIVAFFLDQDATDESDRGKSGHWNTYYAITIGALDPSPFAITAEERMPGASVVLDVGCGNGRDTSYIDNRGHRVTGLDSSASAIALCEKVHEASSADFVSGSVSEYVDAWTDRFDVLYSRFVLHAMTESEELGLWRDARKILRPSGIVMVECRSIKDPLARQGEVLSPTERIAGHYRRFIVIGDLCRRLEDRGFVIDSATEANGLAVHGDEDPVVIRVFAHKG